MLSESKTVNEKAMNAVIPVRPALFENESRIAVFIPNEENIKNLIKKIPKSRWSPSNACWHFLKTPDNWAIFQHYFQGTERRKER